MRKLLSVLFLICVLPTAAQEEIIVNDAVVADTMAIDSIMIDVIVADSVWNDSIKNSYIDSLEIVRHEVFNTNIALSKMRVGSAHKKMLGSEVAYMFLPTTFYNRVVHDAFTIGEEMAPYDVSLLQIYLAHPEWVKGTEREVAEMNELANAEFSPVTPATESIPLPQTEDVKKVAEEVTSAVPVQVAVWKPNFWTYKGDNNLQFMQNYVSSNWYKGGQSSYALMAAVTLEANYNNKQRVKWDNKLELKFGAQQNRSDTVHAFVATDDLIRYTSKLGLQATKKWYYTLQLIAQTQFTHGYKSNDPKLYSDFLAPLTLNISGGMDYDIDWCNHKLKGTAHFAPIAFNMKYTRLLNLSTRLGIEEGKHALYDYGSQFTIDCEWQLCEQLKWKTRLYGFTSYKRAELEWENTFTFQLTRWISAQLFVYPRFDDSVLRDEYHGYFQLKEYASFGFSYSF